MAPPKTKEDTQRIWLMGGGAVLSIVVCSFFLIRQMLGGNDGFVPHTDEFTFVRNMTETGRIDPDKLVDITGEQSLLGIFSEEGVNRYGADTEMPDGVGLTVHFVWKQGTRQIPRGTFEIPAWRRFEEYANNERRRIVREKEKEFARMVEEFVQPVQLTFDYRIVLDTTDGGNQIPPSVNVLARRLEKLAKAGHAVNTQLRIIQDTEYQGEMFEVAGLKQARDLDEGLRWARAQAVKDGSSIYASLVEILRDVQPGTYVEIFTDGMENTSEVNLYKRPELLDSPRWPEIPNPLNDAAMDLTDVTIALHPLKLPPDKDRQQRKALAYLRECLRGKGATVTIES